MRAPIPGQDGQGCAMIEVHLLRYALAAAETGSFSRAADQFRVKQSTLSKRIRHLEIRLGLSLFNRSTQGVIPTAGGVRFLERASVILGDLDRLSADTREMACGRQGRLRIGFQGPFSGRLRAIVADYREAFPAVEIEAVEAEREDLLARLDRDRLDLAVMAGEPAETTRQSLYLWSEPLLVGVREGHRLLERERLYWTDLIGTTLLVTRAGPGELIAAIIASRLTGPDRLPTLVRQSVGRDSLVALATGDSIAVIAGEMNPAPSGIAFRTVHDAFGPTRIDHNLFWIASNTNPALKTFLSIISGLFSRTAEC